MKSIFLMTVIGLLFISCQKDQAQIVPEDKTRQDMTLKDSISFTIDGVKYAANDRFSFGARNRQINIKPFATKIPNRNHAYETGGNWWYGERDSLLVEYNFGFSGNTVIDIGFLNKYSVLELRETTRAWEPKNEFKLQLGLQKFMTDYGRENKTSGVFLKTSIPEKSLSTFIPMGSIAKPSPLDNHIQDDAQFNVLKFEKLEGGFYLLEAEFELNTYDQNNNKFRLKNGYLRLISRFRFND